MTKLPKHLQDMINSYEEKHKKFFGETTQERADKLNKLKESACEFNPIHGLIK